MKPKPGEDPEAFKQQVRRARTMATTFGILAIIALIAIVYAQFAREAAGKQRLQAEQNYVQMLEYKKRAEAAEQKITQMNLMLEKALKDAEEARRQAEESFEKAIKKKK